MVMSVVMAGMFSACAQPKQAPEPVREMRGVWITNVDSEVLFDSTSIVEAMDYLADRGFNLVFPVVWNKGYTLYPSEVMVEYFGEQLDGYAFSQFGWVQSYGSRCVKPPINPEVQDFMLALIRETIENYDVDGIQGDDRLPAMPSEGGYDEYTRALYLAETGLEVPSDPREPAFLQWKADKLSDFGGRLYEMVKLHDPELIVSLSPSVYPWSKEEYLQDYPEWIRRNQVDILHPQAYRYEIDRYKATVEEVALYSGLIADSTGGRYVDPGDVFIAPGVLIKAGPRYNGPDYVLEALKIHRDLGLHGEIYFFYEGLHHANEFLADSLYKYYYNVPAVLPWRDAPKYTRTVE